MYYLLELHGCQYWLAALYSAVAAQSTKNPKETLWLGLECNFKKFLTTCCIDMLGCFNISVSIFNVLPEENNEVNKTIQRQSVDRLNPEL